MLEDSFPELLKNLNRLVDNAILNYKHNVIIIWGELGDGKTSLALWMAYRKIQNWETVLSFKLEPHTCLKCGHTWTSDYPYRFEIACTECSKQTETKHISKAISMVLKGYLVEPFPFDRETGIPKKFPNDTTFILNSSKARGETTQIHPYLNFSFHELRNTIETAVNTRIRIPIALWDDIAVYFHRSNIQYMHPQVKNFFSRYNFVRQYISNLVLTVPTIDFVPDQLSLFCTADILLKDRGMGDFDTKEYRRSFFGKQKSWQKSYDGQDVTWKKVPEKWFAAYEEIRHAHAVQAFEHPEEIFVTTMPKAGKQYTEEESLF